MSSLIKFCGFTEANDVLEAETLDIDYFGLIFVPDTKRYLSLEVAKAFIETIRQQATSSLKFVGVFQNATSSTVESFIQTLGLSTVQYHGNESAELVSNTSVPVIKTLVLSDDMTLDALSGITQQYHHIPSEKLPYFLLDLPKQTHSQKTLHERLLEIAKTPEQLATALGNRPYFLAGKLTAEQLPELLQYWKPAGLDVASGIETEKGQKDPLKMKTFLEATKQTIMPHSI